ncbi:MAG: DUF2867 domain-containing protein [Candidatus Lambdaproteobacteria bacterium]|nr:DUF2867 domain-containing protein [Candidatus Lambdaproteobacteria bacterium]
MRLDSALHRRERWRVHELARDFRLVDYWGFPMRVEPSGRGSFREFIGLVATTGPSSDSLAVEVLLKTREWAGRIFGWDQGKHTLPIPGCKETSLCDRLSEADRVASHPEWVDPPRQQLVDLMTVYVFDSEALFEVSNRTIHALLHFGWSATADGSNSPRMAVYVKSRGFLSDVYMAVIAPFRHWVVYPAWIAGIARKWEHAMLEGFERR